MPGISRSFQQIRSFSLQVIPALSAREELDEIEIPEAPRARGSRRKRPTRDTGVAHRAVASTRWCSIGMQRWSRRRVRPLRREPRATRSSGNSRSSSSPPRAESAEMTCTRSPDLLKRGENSGGCARTISDHADWCQADGRQAAVHRYEPNSSSRLLHTCKGCMRPRAGGKPAHAEVFETIFDGLRPRRSVSRGPTIACRFDPSP